MGRVMNLTAGLAATAMAWSVSATDSKAETLTYLGFAVTPEETVDISSGTPSTSFNNLRTGGFNMQDEASNSFVAWCIDLVDTISNSASYLLSQPAQVSNSEADDLNKLFTKYGGTATANAVNSAAFQVAIWEIVYDSGSGYDLSSGNFAASDNAPVTSAAQSMLDNLGTSMNYALKFYESASAQDLVTGTPPPPPPPPAVPLPAGVLLLASGLGMLRLAQNRKK